MPVAFSDLMSEPTLGGIKSLLIQFCQANGLLVTSWILGDPSERWSDITPRLVLAVLGGITTQAVRGFFLDLATDPGDPGDLSADQTPRAGFLSALGEGWYGTTRGGQTFATSSVTVQNTGATAATFSPYDLTFTDTVDTPQPVVGMPTYRNDVAPSIYTGPGGTLTIGPGASATFPVIAEQIGSAGNASVNALTATTQSFGTLVVTGSTLARGADREDPNLYRARCRNAAAVLAHGGPGAAYTYAANTALDGTPLQRYNGSGEVGITQVYVSSESSTGVVLVYVAGALGGIGTGIDSFDVSSATANMIGMSFGVINATTGVAPIGVLPDGITIGPTTSDPNLPGGTPGCAGATNVVINVAWSARIRSMNVPGGAAPGVYTSAGSPPAPVAALFNAAALAIGTFLPAQGIGGQDTSGGAGVIYTVDIQDAIKDSVAGFYNVVLTLPSTSTTAIGLGYIGVGGTITGTLLVTS